MKRLRLEARVAIWLLGLIGAGAVVTLLAMTHFQRQSLERQFGEAGEVLTQTVKNSLQVSMLANSPDDMQETVRNVQRGTLIESASVYRRDGSTWASSSAAATLTANARAAMLRAMSQATPTRTSTDQTLTVFSPVLKQRECAACHPGREPVLGVVAVTLDEMPLQVELRRSTRNSLYLTAIPLVIGLAASLWAMRRKLLRPLAMVGMAAERVAIGDLQVRLPKFDIEELDSVATTFNEMAARLQRQSDDLGRTVERLRSDLEGLEDIQALLTSKGGLKKLLARAAAHLGSALHANGVGIWRARGRRPAATWGEQLPPTEAILETSDTGVQTSAGILSRIPDGQEVAWAVVPAVRGGRRMAVVGIAWDPPRPLDASERDLVGSLAGVVAIAVENAELLDRLNEKEASLEALLKKTLATQEEERRRVARELHDETSQILSAIMMNIDLLEREVRSRRPYRPRLAAVKALAEEASRNVDKVMLDLRPALLDDLGLVASLRWYASQVQGLWDLPVELEASKVQRMPEHLEVAAFRIVQEAVSNAVRHGKPSGVRVAVSSEQTAVRIEINDDGAGFDVSKALARARTGDSAGLLGMTERAELLGGSFKVTSRPGKGTRIVVEIPFARG